jgi:hypothetical protein
MGVTTPAIGGVAAGHQAADSGVAFRVGAGARGTVMVRSMTVGAMATERGIGEGVLREGIKDHRRWSECTEANGAKSG